MNQQVLKMRGRDQVTGWGVDLPEERRPAVPKEAPSTVTRPYGKELPRQRAFVKINRSLEHGKMPPVFGSTCPPKGLSGMLRNYAYAKHSEGALRHWLILMLADRVDVAEGLLSDVAHGKIPNIIKERGLLTEFTHTKGLKRARNFAVIGGLGALVGALTTAGILRLLSAEEKQR